MGHPMSGTAVAAIGGNALVLGGEPGSIPRQQERAAETSAGVFRRVVASPLLWGSSRPTRFGPARHGRRAAR
jgi:hypothetical protein